MEQLPKIVGQRLQRVKAEGHPDANLLAAFAEKSLLPREQAQVTEHLARCATCRKVLAHAQPEEVLQGPAAVPARGSSWFHSSAIRWVALAACIVVVGAVVISRSNFERKSASKIAPYNAPVEVAKTEAAPAPAPSSAPSEPVATRRDESEAVQLKDSFGAARKRDTDQVAGLEKRQIAEVPKSSVEKTQVGGSAGELDSKQKVSSTNETVEVSSATVPVESQSLDETKANKKEFSADKAMKAPAGSNEVALAQALPAAAPPAPPANGRAASTVATNSPAQEESSVVNGLYRAKDGFADNGAAVGALHSGIRYPTPRWQISPEGALLKSGDLGRSWQPVTLGDKVVFHALSVSDREVWAGGSGGNLFYSPNAGESWQQIKPSSSGQTLTSGITGIEFKDSQHGKVTTADHQTWTTSDAGHTWKLETR
jgi:hypothetical protein